jgi:hypothetical protein
LLHIDVVLKLTHDIAELLLKLVLNTNQSMLKLITWDLFI